MKTNGSKPLLKVENLGKSFSLRPGLFARGGPVLKAIDQVSFEIQAGQIFGLVGESGSGKSTLGRAILQLIKADTGAVYFRDLNLCQANKPELNAAREKLQVIFQDPSASLSPRRNIFRSLLEPLEQFSNDKPEIQRQQCEHVLERVGLDKEVLGRLPHQLSSGQRQRVGIARAILTRPDLIIADEAVSALDVSVQAQILELIRSLREDLGVAFLFISHDLAVISQVADVVAVMFQGQIVEMAPVASLFDQPAHPYTQELLNAIPDPNPAIPLKSLKSKGGLSREAKASGCVYAGRCSSVMSKCHEIAPEQSRLESNPQHHVKCHLNPRK
jgi:oligopeptide/dipeptide ABC transporter ATP-binding protein